MPFSTSVSRRGSLLNSQKCTPRAPAHALKVSCMATDQHKKILMMGTPSVDGISHFLDCLRWDAFYWGLFSAGVAVGHDVTLFTRGKAPIAYQIPDDTLESFEIFSSKIKHIAGDRKDYADLKAKIGKQGFEFVYDINAREAEEVAPILEAIPELQQYLFCSSAGVYKKSFEMPHYEVDEVDPKSRHKGKFQTEELLTQRGVNFTSIRPTYIYGPLNYNPVEEWFFHRLKADRPIPVPGSGMQITQLGHVKDLSDAFALCLDNPVAMNQIYNISDERYVTFDGVAKACAIAMGKPEPELVHFDAKDFDFGKKKPFPMRDQHFFASVEKAQKELGWTPKFSLIDGLKDSYDKDFGRGTYRKEADFSTDDLILEKMKSTVSA